MWSHPVSTEEDQEQRIIASSRVKRAKCRRAGCKKIRTKNTLKQDLSSEMKRQYKRTKGDQKRLLHSRRKSLRTRGKQAAAARTKQHEGEEDAAGREKETNRETRQKRKREGKDKRENRTQGGDGNMSARLCSRTDSGTYVRSHMLGRLLPTLV